MANRFFVRLILSSLLLMAGVGLRFAWVNADVLSGSGAQLVLPSGVPAMLGAINENGRTGWLCRPELAASAKKVGAAELPQGLRP
jgi:hypothetical protein